MKRSSRTLVLYSFSVYGFLYLPLMVLAVFSFNASRFTTWQGFSMRWYEALYRDGQIAEATWNSLLIAAVAAVLSTLAGTMCAYALWKRRLPLLSQALLASLVTPEVVVGVALLAFFQGLFRYVHLQLGMHTVILAHLMFCLAYVVIVISASLRTMDPALEEAAQDLGANEWEAFRSVTLPLLAPAIGSAALLAFTISFDDYVITSLVAGVDSETLPMVIYAMARRGGNPVVNAISTIIVAGLALLIIAAEELRRRAAAQAVSDTNFAR